MRVSDSAARLTALTLVVATQVCAPGAALAKGASGECTDASRECAKAAYDAGVKAFKEGAYERALERFKHAHSVKAHPSVTFNLALAEEKNDLVVEALKHLDEATASPDAKPKLKEQIAAERERMQRQLATVIVEVSSGKEVVLQVGALSATGLDAQVTANPGQTKVVVKVDGKVRVEREMMLRRGETLRLSVANETEREVVVREPTDEEKKSPPETDQGVSSNGLSPVWFFGAAGVTLVLGGISVWSAVDTSSAKSDFDALPASTPRAERQAALDDGKSRETRTNILLAGTAIGVVGSAVLGLFLVDWSGADKESARLGVGFGSVTFSGRF